MRERETAAPPQHNSTQTHLQKDFPRTGQCRREATFSTKRHGTTSTIGYNSHLHRLFHGNDRSRIHRDGFLFVQYFVNNRTARIQKGNTGFTSRNLLSKTTQSRTTTRDG
jgi:hypothetical protein